MATIALATGQVVQLWRKSRQLNQTQLAESAGVSKGYLSQLESGKIANPGRQKLAQLAMALEIPLATLLLLRTPSEVVDDPSGDARALRIAIQNGAEIQNIFASLDRYVQSLAWGLLFDSARSIKHRLADVRVRSQSE